MKLKTYILTIAGHDPSSGAGITSDIKTFEAHGVYGLSVCTAITVQNDSDFKTCLWIEKEVIINQIQVLFERYEITMVKIGIIQSWEILLEVVQKLKQLNPTVKIVLDPILKATSGFIFHSKENLKTFNNVLYYCDFITPNYDEIQELFPDKSIEETIVFISEKTNIYLKGGHRKDNKGSDEVYYSKIVRLNIAPNITVRYQKHGSGCVLSSALASNLAQDMSIEDACKSTKWYIEHFLNSNTSLLGTHNYNHI